MRARPIAAGLITAGPIAAGLFAAGIAVTAGCSNQQMYNAIQDNRRQQCAKLPQAQFEACMREHDTTYADYLREQPQRPEQ